VLNEVVDTLLDRTIVPGFSRIGYRVRSRAFAPTPPDALAGEAIAVTGANSGLGEAAALGAARLGADVHLLCRDTGRGAAAADRIRRHVPDATLTVHECDLARADRFVEPLSAALPPLHALVHNAGVLPAERTESPAGHELTVEVHVLGPHVLTAALPAERVIFVSSGGMYSQRLPVDDWEYTGSTYRGTTAYARSKRMQVVLAERWARDRPDLFVASMHPGWASTPGVTDSLPGFDKLFGPIFRTPEQGADTTVWLMTADVPSGLFWHDRRPRATSMLPTTRTSAADAEALWRYVVEATGVGPT
jgi:dehydrogenase/reductase SDR family member 12